jgi:anti-sigma factor RsiW
MRHADAATTVGAVPSGDVTEDFVERQFDAAVHAALTALSEPFWQAVALRILQHYLDDQLDGRRSELLVAHLDACRRCGLEAQTYRRIKDTLAVQRATLPAESVARLRQFGEQLSAGHHH